MKLNIDNLVFRSAAFIGVMFISIASGSFAQTLTIANNQSYVTSSSETYTGLSLGNSAVLTVNSGHTLTINGSGTSNNGFGIVVQENAVLNITGVLNGNNNISLSISGEFIVGGIVISNNGSLSVGGLGEISVNGDFTAGTGAVIDVDGGMSVDGDLSLGSGSTFSNDGTLSISGGYSGVGITGSGSSETTLYSCDMESCGSNWDNNGFSDGSSYSGGCDGDGLYDNVWGSGSYSKLTAYNYNAITGHNGGELSVSVKVKLRDYYSSYSDNSSSEWGNLKIYYKTTRPSDASPGTQIGSTITSSADCEVHTVSFSPGTTISNLYLAFVYDNEGVGDNWIIYDDVTIREIKEAESVSWNGSVSDSWGVAGNWSSGSVPTSVSKVVITDVSNQPVLSSDVVVGGLTVDSGADITVSSNALTVSGVFDLNGTLNIGNAIVNADGEFDANGGEVDFTSSNGKLVLSSTVSSLGDLDDALGTVEYDGVLQTVISDDYYNLLISSSGSKVAGGNIDVNGDFTTAATVGCELDMGTYDLKLAGDLNVGAIDGLDLTDGSSLLVFDGGGDQIVTHAGSSAGSGGSFNLINEGFENSGSIPSGWSQSNVSGSNDFTFENGAGYTTPSSAYSGSYNALMFASRGSVTKLITPALDFSTFSENATLTFYHAQVNWDGDQDELRIYYKTSSGGSWTLIQTYNTEQATWVQRSIALPNVNSTYYIAFEGTSDYGHGLVIDNVVVTAESPAGSGSEVTSLSINKASGNVKLNSDFSVDGTLTFTSGIIDATSNDLTFTSSATVTGASDASHVKGVVNKNTASTSQFIFPIGDGTTYSPIAVTPNATSSTDWEVSYSNAAYSDLSIDASGLDHVSSNEYWNLNRVSGTADAVVDIWWTSADDVTDYADLTIAHYNGTDWEMIATSPYGTNSSGYIRSQGPVTSFSPFTIGTTSNVNALPVGIVMFEGKEENLKNKLLWQVASEKNVDHFIVEKTKDGEFFEFVGSLISEQSDLEIHNYSLMDEKVDPIINYYRLIAVDLNGVHTKYNLISIDNRSMVVEKELLKITNMWGQDVQPGYKGQVIYIYTDGSIERRFVFD